MLFKQSNNFIRRILPTSIGLVTLAKIMAVGIFFLFLPIFPVNSRYSLYNKNEFIGRPSTTMPPWIVHWANFDGFYYLLIARDGYESERVAFFPLYPIITHGIHSLFQQTQPYVVIGQIVSFIGLVGALSVVALLLKEDGVGKYSPLILLIILCFPTAYSYTAVYNDSLFFFLASLTLLLARKRRWFWASIIGAFATLTRLNGLALFPFLIIEYLFAKPKRIKSIIWSLFIPATFIGYLGYIQHTFGNWQLLFTSMKIWGQDRMIIPFQTMFRYLKIMTTVSPMVITYWIAVLEIGCFLWYCFMLWKSWGKIRFSYLVFFFFSILIPALTGTFQGMPRYGLHLYPLFLGTALWLIKKPSWVKIIYFSISFILYIICVTLFTHGIFIA